MTDPLAPEPAAAQPEAGGARVAGRGNWPMLAKLTVIALVMFGFGWALVPLYKKICEITGINTLTQRDKQAEQFAKNTQVDTSRKVIVEFDANARGSWLFRPEKNAVEVHPGELTTVVYEVVNTQPRPVQGQAIPSYAPRHAGQYFRKLECFCFKQQVLVANETRKFPVVFVIDPNLPRDIGTITLSYTLFEVAGPPAAGAPPAVLTVRGG